MNKNMWYPKASDLKLPDVRADKREQVRARLKPILARLTPVDIILNEADSDVRLAVTKGDCWRVHQSLVLTAADPGICYIEGAWQSLTSEKKVYADPSPHAWTLVDGYIVDLSNEFLIRRDGPREQVEREPLREFTYTEVRQVLEDLGDWEPLMNVLWSGTLPEELQEKDGEPFDAAKFDKQQDFMHQDAYKPATERLAARLEQEGKVKVRVPVDPSLARVYRVPDHEDGTAICKLATAFGEAGFRISSCRCCDDVGYAAPDNTTFLWTVEHLQKVSRAIKGIKGLSEDYKQVQTFIKNAIRDKQSMPLFEPKAFKFEVHYEPRELHANCGDHCGAPEPVVA
jgi:hypothetical protein